MQGKQCFLARVAVQLRAMTEASGENDVEARRVICVWFTSSLSGTTLFV